MKQNILVIYYLWQYPVRSTILSHLYAFRNYSDCRVSYLNIANPSEPKVPSYIAKFSWDLIVFTDIALAPWDRPLFRKIIKSLEPLAENRAAKIATPQDEFVNVDLMNQFMNDFGISHIFTTGPEAEWPKAYPLVNRSKTKMHQALTGYLDDKTISRIAQLNRTMPSIRPIDIGYRAMKHKPWLGRHTMLKWQIGEEFKKRIGTNFVADISSSPNAVLYGDDWWRFLLSCNYFLGTETGASILDWDGSIKAKTEAYLKEHPDAPFEEVEQACFPNIDGTYQWRTIGPRNLECAATYTCQILAEDNYNGILKPWVHYIPVKYDLSNIDEVLNILLTNKDLIYIAERAYRDIVESGKYSYRRHIPWLLDITLPKQRPFEKDYKAEIIQKRMYIEDWIKWQSIKASLAKR